MAWSGDPCDRPGGDRAGVRSGRQQWVTQLEAEGREVAGILPRSSLREVLLLTVLTVSGSGAKLHGLYSSTNAQGDSQPRLFTG